MAECDGLPMLLEVKRPKTWPYYFMTTFGGRPNELYVLHTLQPTSIDVSGTSARANAEVFNSTFSSSNSILHQSYTISIPMHILFIATHHGCSSGFVFCPL